MEAVAPSGVTIGALEDVAGALEHGELGVLESDLDLEPSKSDSCGGFSSVTHSSFPRPPT
jgi:hypothetical protein